MVIVLQHGIHENKKQRIKEFLIEKGFRVREIVGEEETIFGAVGLVQIDQREVELLDGVQQVIPITKPYKLASREFKKEDTLVSAGPVKLGGSRIVVIAGPCAVESKEQIHEAAEAARASGAVMLRGGAYKPRTSPYSFQGLGEEGLRYLKEASEATGLPVVTEIVSPDLADMMKEYVDIFQIGTRNMQNFELLKKVGALDTPVILKRGLAATIQDWLMAAEYLLAHGAEDVILCERGIRTFETYTRNTLDLSAIPVIKKLSHLPVIVDPSHATGIRAKVPPMALAAVAAGADGLIVEMHPNPDAALSDGPQSLYPEQLEKLMRDIEALSPVLGKEIARLPAKTARPGASNLPGMTTGTPAGGKKYTVAFQGERGAYSEKALYRFFPEGEPAPVPAANFRKVFENVLSGKTEWGIIPIENSLAGSIHENYDLLLQYPDVRICGEQKIRIQHNLLALPDTDETRITKVYSHPQGLAQCDSFLDTHPEWERVPFYDTAGSARYIVEKKLLDAAAIASAEAADAYGLTVLREGIETNPRNYTRFVIIAPEETATSLSGFSNPDMASLVFATLDKPGALFFCLRILADHELNMKKLESRPIQGKPWEYMFYVDVEVKEKRDNFFSALESLRKETQELRVLGIYSLKL